MPFWYWIGKWIGCIHVFRSVCVCACVSHQQLVKKEAMNFKEYKEGYIRGLEGRKEREKLCNYSISKKKERNN